jgi:hypothetical protein
MLYINSKLCYNKGIMSDFELAGSRPAFMRNELGPIMHAMTPDLLEAANEVFATTHHHRTDADMINYDTSNEMALAMLAVDLHVIAARVALIWCRNNPAAAIELQDRLYEYGYTYHKHAGELITEGLGTGFNVPINIYAGAQMAIHGRSAGQKVFSPADFMDTWYRSDSNRVISEIAYANNGALGPWSTDTDISQAIFDRTGDEVNERLLHPISIGTNGEWLMGVKLKSELNKTMKTNNTSSRTHDLDSKVSSGCPVRYDVYRKLTPFAEYFIGKYLDPENLQNPNNAITQCAQFAGNYAVSAFTVPQS